MTFSHDLYSLLPPYAPWTKTGQSTGLSDCQRNFVTYFVTVYRKRCNFMKKCMFGWNEKLQIRDIAAVAVSCKIYYLLHSIVYVTYTYIFRSLEPLPSPLPPSISSSPRGKYLSKILRSRNVIFSRKYFLSRTQHFIKIP